VPIALSENTIPFPNKNFPDLEILHLSDFHTTRPQPSLEKFLKERIGAKTYDMVFLTGDLVDERSGIAPFIRYISHIKARYGIYATWGNHDMLRIRFRDIFLFREGSADTIPKSDFREGLQREMEAVGIQVLSDELRVINTGTGKLYILGMDDFLGSDRLQNWYRHGPRLERIRSVLKSIPDDGSLRLVLTHSPDVIEKLGGLGIDVMFAGHTHGGQIRLPFLGAIFTWSAFQRKYNHGLYRYNGTYLHVNSGLGTSPYTPVRICCPPEVSLIKIKSRS
jgi:predicted MPP superfamily phosphohydrolase